jgi:HSP20 family protein
VARIHIERLDPGDEVGRLVEWLGEGPGGGPAQGEWTPPMDVFESADALEVLADLPGVAADTIQVIVTRELLVISGFKKPGKCEHHDVAFHLVERSVGRFARAFRLAGAFDIARATAHVAAGELHVVLPRIEERRGREIRIAIHTT